MLYYAIALQYPFEGDTEEKLYKSIKEDPLVFEPKEAWVDIPKELKRLVEQMLEKDPSKRIDIEKIPIHKCFKEIHDIERDTVFLTDEEIEKFNRYYKLNPIQRKFLKYSTKFVPPKEKVENCEKFTLLDKENLGYIKFHPDIHDSESSVDQR